jgi:hypothetical protein
LFSFRAKGAVVWFYYYGIPFIFKVPTTAAKRRLPAEWYLPTFLSLTILTEILRYRSG